MFLWCFFNSRLNIQTLLYYYYNMQHEKHIRKWYRGVICSVSGVSSESGGGFWISPSFVCIVYHWVRLLYWAGKTQRLNIVFPLSSSASPSLLFTFEIKLINVTGNSWWWWKSSSSSSGCVNNALQRHEIHVDQKPSPLHTIPPYKQTCAWN